MARYKTWEAVKMLTENPELEFGMVIGGKKIDYTLSVKKTPQGNRFFRDIGEGYTEFIYLDETWELVRKPATFMEAVKAYKEGKMIACDFEGHTYKYNGKKDDQMVDAEDNAVSCEEILDGKWYIEEE